MSETAQATVESGQTQTAAPSNASAPNTDSGANATEAQLQELAAGDYDKLVAWKDETSGKVEKIKLKEAINRAKTYERKALKAQEYGQNSVKQTVQEIAAYAKSNPREFMQKLGIDPYEFSEATLKEKVELLNASPEQRRLRELEEENQRLKKTYEEEQLSKQAQAQQAKLNREIQSLDKELSQAFAQSGLPKNKFFFQWAAAIMHDDAVRQEHEMQTQGYLERDPLSASDAIAIVKERFPSLLSDYVKALDVKQLRELLTEDVIGKIREEDIKRVTNQDAPKKANGTPTKADPKEPKVFTRDEDFRAWAESKKI